MMPAESYRDGLITNLLTVRDSIKKHQDLFETEKEYQHIILERIWVLAQRYSIVIKTVPTKLNFPYQAHNSPDNEIKTELLDKLCLLASSNLKLAFSLTALTDDHQALRQFLDEIGAEKLSSLETTSILQLPFVSCIEILEDFIKYFTKIQGHMDCFALLIKPESVQSVERYKKLFKQNKDFVDYFSQSMAMLNLLKKPS